MLEGSSLKSSSSSDSEVLQAASSPSDSEEIAESSAVSQKYDLAVIFEKAVEEKLKESSEDNIIKLWHEVVQHQVIKDKSDDQTIRPLFVNLQAANESAITSFLEQRKITCSIGVIHTPTPATPLRADPKKIEKGVVTDEIANDPKRLETVTKRAEGIRNYLEIGGTLYSVYKNDKVPGMDTLNSLVKQYPGNLYLKKRDDSKPDMPTGATYLYGNDKGWGLSFFIEITQANIGSSEKHGAAFGYACVDLNKIQTEDRSNMNKVEEHLVEINSFLKDCNIDMIEIYKNKVSTSLQEVSVIQPYTQGLNAA